jgi:hypothetical protein
LVNLDLITSSILGRTAATSISKTWDGEMARSNTLEILTLQSSFELSLLVNEIVNTMYSPEGASVKTGEHYLALLNQWSQSLPSQIRIKTLPVSADEGARARIVGSLHVSCYYHFAVMLVSRPFLISHLIATANLRQEYLEDHFSDMGTNKTISGMAQVCVRAAVLMAQACSDVDEAGFMLENMCIVKQVSNHALQTL